MLTLNTKQQRKLLYLTVQQNRDAYLYLSIQKQQNVILYLQRHYYANSKKYRNQAILIRRDSAPEQGSQPSVHRNL
jgi:hypothetical protein